MNYIKIVDRNNIDDISRSFLNNTLKEVMQIVAAECGSLFLFDSDNKELVLNSFFNSGNLQLRGLKQKIGEGIAGKVISIKTPVLVKDITTDTRFHKNGFGHYKTNSFICVPLFTSKGIIGLLNLADKSSGESFQEKDLEIAVAITKYACLTLDSFCNFAGLKHEKDRLHKQNSLLEKYASVGKLAAGIVHEVNNPLDGVMRYTSILLGHLNDNSIAREYLLEVRKGLNRIANTTKSLLEFSRQVNSETPKAKNYSDVRQLIDDSIDALKSKVNGNVNIVKKYKEDMPKILDFGLMHVVINLIKNALDAMPEGGTLEISTDIKYSVVEIAFKDTGRGIPTEIKERIFEPFFTTKSMDKGTGLGLAISNEIIKKYAGTIEVRSSLGEGSTFVVLIPKNYLENA